MHASGAAHARRIRVYRPPVHQQKRLTIEIITGLYIFLVPFRYRNGAGDAYGGGVHDSSLKTNALGNQGQYGNAGGFRGTDNRGGTISNSDLYRAGGVGGAGASGGALGPIASPPLLIQQTLPVVQRALPVAPPPAHYAVRSHPYVVPAPAKLYVDRPGVQNVLVAAV